MAHYNTINILDLLATIGEDEVQLILSDFLCPINPDIEHFIHQNAIEFAKQKIAITYLVLDSQKRCLGYFTLTHKPITIEAERLSNTSKKKIERVAHYNDEQKAYSASAFLVAQFGKNYGIENNPLSGEELMGSTMEILHVIQHLVGGNLIFLECENEEKLLNFYRITCGFYVFGQRLAESSDKKDMWQLMRFLRSKKSETR